MSNNLPAWLLSSDLEIIDPKSAGNTPSKALLTPDSGSPKNLDALDAKEPETWSLIISIKFIVCKNLKLEIRYLVFEYNWKAILLSYFLSKGYLGMALDQAKVSYNGLYNKNLNKYNLVP